MTVGANINTQSVYQSEKIDPIKKIQSTKSQDNSQEQKINDNANIMASANINPNPVANSNLAQLSRVSDGKDNENDSFIKQNVKQVSDKNTTQGIGNTIEYANEELNGTDNVFNNPDVNLNEVNQKTNADVKEVKESMEFESRKVKDEILATYQPTAENQAVATENTVETVENFGNQNAETAVNSGFANIQNNAEKVNQDVIINNIQDTAIQNSNRIANIEM